MAVADIELQGFDARVHLVRQRVLREIRAGSDWAEGQLDHLFSGFLGRILNPLARRVYHTVGREEVIRRTQEQMDLLVIAARDLENHSLDDVVDRHLYDALHTEEIYVRGKRDHPAFEEVENLLMELFRERVWAVGRLLHEGRGETYDELVASAFARPEVEAILAHQFEGGERLLAIVEEHPEIVGMPRTVRGPVVELVEGAFDWYRDRLQDQLDEMFDAGGPGDDRPRGTAGAC